MGLKKRPLHVKQKETDAGQYWYTVDKASGSTMLTSEMYTTRSNAKRAARTFIAAIGGVPVTFSFVSGPDTGDRGQLRRVVERFNGA